MAKKRNVSKYFDFKYVDENIHDGDSIQQVLDVYGDPTSKSIMHVGQQFEYVTVYRWEAKLKDKAVSLICQVKKGFTIVVRHEYTEVYFR